jgi:hypothetical protein
MRFLYCISFFRTRDGDIKKAFSGTKDGTLNVAAKYNASYAYIGSEEPFTWMKRIWFYKSNISGK